jgi:hypothetical protein
MKTINTRRFTREFPKIHGEPCLVTDRGQVIGSWTPVAEKPEPMDFASRVRRDFSRQLPFTGAELLKRGKKR